MADAHANFAVSTVATAPSPATSGTSLVVASGHGTRFPAVSFNATVWPAGVQPTPANAEIVRVSNISTDTFTIARTQESTSARTIIVGDQIAATITKKTLTDIESAGSGAMVQVIDSTLGGSAASFDFTSIAGTYNHLQLWLYLRSDRGSGNTFDNIRLRFNNDTTANYDWEKVQASATSVSASEDVLVQGINLGFSTAASAPAGTFGTYVVHIPAYVQTTGQKTTSATGGLRHTGASGGTIAMWSWGQWLSTAAITRITVAPEFGTNWVTGSRATLYGIT